MINYLINVSALVGQGLAYSKVYFYHLSCLISLPSFVFNLKTAKLSSYSKIIPLFVLFLLMSLSISWSEYKSAGVMEILQFAMGLYLLIYNKTLKVRAAEIEKTILWVVGFNLFICLAEISGMFRYPFSQYAEMAVFFKRNFYDWYPMETDIPTGLHWNPNNNSFFLLIFSPVVLSLLRFSWQKIFYLLLSTYIFYKTRSKTLIVGWIFFLLLLTSFQIRTSLISLKKIGTIAFSFVAVAAIYVTFSENSFQSDRYSKILPSLKSFTIFVPEMIFKRVSGDDIEFDFMARDSSLHERLTMLDGLIKSISEHPLVGTGAGGLSQSIHTQAGVTKTLNTPHFYFLEVWAKYGFIFFLIYVIWFLNLFWKALRMKNMSSMSLLLFFLFSPVVSTLSYFLPKWVLYSYAITVTDPESFEPESHG